MQNDVSRMVVRGVCQNTNVRFSGCIVSEKGHVLSTAHQLFAGDFLVQQEYNMSMIVCGVCVVQQYTLEECNRENDYATFTPIDSFAEPAAHFQRRELPLHNDEVFLAARCGDTCSFILSEGIFNYPNWVTAYADNGWSGGPVFHAYAGVPILVGLVCGRRGQTQYCTSIVLVPQKLLTNVTVHPYYTTRSWEPYTSKNKETSSGTSAATSLSTVTDSSNEESPDGKRTCNTVK